MHRVVIDGRIYRDVPLPAADTRKAGKHISAEPPISAAEQRAVRKAAQK